MSFEMPVKSSPEESTTTNLEQASFPPEICDSMHNDVIYTTEPMPFIQSVANGKLLVNPRAHDMLSRIEKPLVVISIAGLYRTGRYNVMYVWASSRRFESHRGQAYFSSLPGVDIHSE